MATMEYHIGNALLTIDNVCLNYDKPILRNVNAQISDIICDRVDVNGKHIVKGQVVGFLGPSGIGKCLAKGTPVLKYDGTIVPVEAIRVGDLLMGSDSCARRVLSLAHGVDEMYDVVPIKGNPYCVNKPHILSLKLTGGKRPIVNVSVEDYLKKSKTFKGRAKTYRVGVEFPAQETPIDPYFLGLWLGDGDSDLQTITTEDSEVVNFLHVLAADPAVNGTVTDKHVPLLYRANSRDVRLKVLAGLMDSDGHLINGCYDFVSKLEQLANDVTFLARSLGLAAYVHPVKKTCVNNGKVGNYFRVCISGDLSVIPTKLLRKSANSQKQIKDVLVSGISVTPVGLGEYFGFELDGDGLFLLGDFTVTHNTQLFRIISGLNRPTSGHVYINNCNCGRVDCNKERCEVRAGDIGVVAQSYPLFYHRDIKTNLMLAAMQVEKTEKIAMEKIANYLTEFGLYDKLHAYPASLSGGQRQRVAIIQQILCSSHFILMDEPFSGLDPINLEKTVRLIQQVADLDELNTIIVVTHDVTAACAVSDHIWMLGRDHDPSGCALPGSYIVKSYNLIDENLAWQPDLMLRPDFMAFVAKIKKEFWTL